MEFSYGYILRILLPDNWAEIDRVPHAVFVTYGSDDWGLEQTDDGTVCFQCPDDEGVGITFYRREEPLSEHTYAKFCKLLAEPPHKLTPAKIREHDIILREASEEAAFRLTDARTELLNGRMVYAVEGNWRLADVDSLGLFIADNNGNSRWLYEVYFMAPPDKFAQYMPDARKAFGTIQWT